MEEIYFGHPINTYGKIREVRLINKIIRTFPNCQVINPNNEYYARKYREYKEERGNGMLFFLEEVLPNADYGVFLSFSDGMFGAGVFREAEWMKENDKPIYEISWKGKISEMILERERALSVEEMRRRVYS